MTTFGSAAELPFTSSVVRLPLCGRPRRRRCKRQSANGWISVSVAGTRPSAGEVDEGADRRLVVAAVGAPDEARRYVGSGIERQRDHAWVRDAPGDPRRCSRDCAAGGDDLPALVGTLNRVVRALRRTAAVLVERP